METVIKIQNRVTKVFGAGGIQQLFSDRGKFWYKLGHINSFVKHLRNTIVVDCDIITYNLVEVSRVPLVTYAKNLKEKSLADKKKEVD